VARYFTPTEVSQQMVRLARPRAAERVLDMTSGSGGFLAECVAFVASEEGQAAAQRFLRRRLVGMDDDPFCVSCSRALLTFLYPQHADELQVFLHNSLYQRAPRGSEIDEDSQAEPHLEPGRYDLVIGNPPGNDEYSGSNRDEIARQWAARFGHAEGGLMDHHCFLRRAVELARPDGGRICLLVPEGLLARDNRGMPALREALLKECDLRAVIALPRVFKTNHARMAIVLMVRGTPAQRWHRSFMAGIEDRWVDSEGRCQATDFYGELERVVDEFLAKAQAGREVPGAGGLRP
jgi:type I restriction-modification system DNA methylase subunit